MRELKELADHIETLYHLAYQPSRDYPLVVARRGGKNYRGIECRDNRAYDELERVRRIIRRLNQEIQKFFDSYG